MPKTHEKITEDSQHIIQDHKIYKPNKTLVEWSIQIVTFLGNRIVLLFCKIHNSLTTIDMNPKIIGKDSEDLKLILDFRFTQNY